MLAVVPFVNQTCYKVGLGLKKEPGLEGPFIVGADVDKQVDAVSVR
jgi:hypothetical protein